MKLPIQRLRTFLMWLVCIIYPAGVLVSMTMHSKTAGPCAGVGGGGGGRGCVWHHATQGTRPAGLRHDRAPRGLYPVPHREGTSTEGRHLGAPRHPPAGPRTPGARLCSCLPCNLQSFHHHQHPHRAAVPEVSLQDINIHRVGYITRLCLRLLLTFVLSCTETFLRNFFIHIFQNINFSRSDEDKKSNTHQTGS